MLKSSPFVVSFRKHYPWVQLSGHSGESRGRRGAEAWQGGPEMPALAKGLLLVLEFPHLSNALADSLQLTRLVWDVLRPGPGHSNIQAEGWSLLSPCRGEGGTS